jgi:23S rRNA pseudouridine1911/1915/1917 synthase
LHAKSLSFEHPGTGDVVRFDSDYPADLAAALAILRGPVDEPGASWES